MASITISLLLRWLDVSQSLYIIDDGSLLDEFITRHQKVGPRLGALELFSH